MQRRTALWLAGFVVWLAVAIAAQAQTPAAAEDTATLTVKGAVKHELALTHADLKAMPRTKVTGHDGATREYEGVALNATQFHVRSQRTGGAE